ncbi:MAG: hypothetical protein Q9207_005535 [Kuettlingeria erythrocarpa]
MTYSSSSTEDDFIHASTNQSSFFYGVAEDFGYVPQALLDWMLEDPSFVEEYPDLVSCLPGGPSIEVVSGDGFCFLNAPAIVEPVPALTVSTAFVVQGAGCFRPGACPTDPVSSEAAGSRITSPAASAPTTATVDPLQLEVSASTSLAEHSPNIQTKVATSTSLTSVEHAVPALDGGSKPPDTTSVEGASTANGHVTTSMEGQPQDQPKARPEDQTVGQSQQEIASLIMQGLGFVAASPVQGPASPEAAQTITAPGGPPIAVPASTGAGGPLTTNFAAGNAASGGIAASVNFQATTSPVLDGNAASIVAGSSPPTGLRGPETQSPSGQSAEDGSQNQPVLIGSLSLSPGSSAISISGTIYSIPAHGTAVIINGTPYPLLVSEGTVGPDTEPIIVAGKTITPGSPAMTVSGATYALPADAASILVNGSPSPLPLSLGRTNDAPSMASAGTVKSPLLTAGQLVTPGDPAVVVSGTTYSIPPAATNLLINGSPSSLSTPNPGQDKPALVIASETLSPGSQITVSGQVISLPATGTGKIIAGGKTESLVRSLPTGSSSAVLAIFTIDGSSVIALETTVRSGNAATAAFEMNATLSGPPHGSSSAPNGSITNETNGPVPTILPAMNLAVEHTYWETSWMGLWTIGLGLALVVFGIL